MTIFDYLNSKRGSSLLAIYATMLVILVVVVLACVIVLKQDKPTDIPEHIAYLFGFIVAAGLGAHVAESKIPPPTEPPARNPPPAP